jgi:hypothetical protein
VQERRVAPEHRLKSWNSEPHWDIVPKDEELIAPASLIVALDPVPDDQHRVPLRKGDIA